MGEKNLKAYLSHGMGVNSTALMLLLEDKGVEFESVFVDHGGDYPETYEYVEYLQGQGYEITVLKPNVEGHEYIEHFCKEKGIVPSPVYRWCTDKFKLQTIGKYAETPAVVFIGIASDEVDRAYGKPIRVGLFNAYPLVNREIDREGCIEIIEKHGLEVPRESECWFCPHANDDEVRQLKNKYPDLYERRKEMEQKALDNYGEKYTISGKKTEEITMENYQKLDGDCE